MSIPPFEALDAPYSDFLVVEVDMRGRVHSSGRPDCNGYELFDVIDAIEYVKLHYADYILDPELIYFEGGSGGGGNALALAAKFPDCFAHITALSGISDYRLWYDCDSVGEFRDELDVWVGERSNDAAYVSRSGLELLQNLTAPLAIAHGDSDLRVPCEHSRRYAARAEALGKGSLVTCLELENVGGRGHYSNATEAQLRELDAFRAVVSCLSAAIS